jgi:hypothetical protein
MPYQWNSLPATQGKFAGKQGIRERITANLGPFSRGQFSSRDEPRRLHKQSADRFKSWVGFIQERTMRELRKVV